MTNDTEFEPFLQNYIRDHYTNIFNFRHTEDTKREYENRYFEVILKHASRMFSVKSLTEEPNPVEHMCHVIKSPQEAVIEVRVNFYYEN